MGCGQNVIQTSSKTLNYQDHEPSSKLRITSEDMKKLFAGFLTDYGNS